MSTTDTTNAPSWRDLADKLTPEQVRSLERREAGFVSQPHPGGDDEVRKWLLSNAVEHIEGNATDRQLHGDVPVPVVDGLFVWHWEFDADADEWRREFSTVGDKAGAACVSIEGYQRPDGSVVAKVYVSVSDRVDSHLSTDDARKLCGLIAATAKTVDRLNGVPLHGHCDACGLEHWRGECQPLPCEPMR